MPHLISIALGKGRDSWQGLKATRSPLGVDTPNHSLIFFLHFSEYWVYRAPFNTFLASPDAGASSSSVVFLCANRMRWGLFFVWAGLFLPQKHLSPIFWWENNALGETLHWHVISFPCMAGGISVWHVWSTFSKPRGVLALGHDKQVFFTF